MSTNQHAHHESIVVTGVGVVTPVGSDRDAFWQNACSQDTNSAEAVSLHGRADFDGKIDDFGPLAKDTKRVIRKSLKMMNRETQLGVAAAQHAITESGLLDAGYEPDRVGVCFGAGNVEIRRSDFQAGVDACQDLMQQFDPAVWGQLGIPHIDPLWILRVLPNMPACHTAIANNLRGPNNTITQARVATNMAFAEARNAILDGDADAMVVGGTGTNLLETIPSDADEINRPAEAAAAFVIERLGHAAKRGAPNYGEILTTGSATAIASNHQANLAEAIAGAIKNALHYTHLDPQSIAAIQMNRQETRLRHFVDGLGDAAAGSSALNIATMLLAFQREQNVPPLACNIDTLESGLASCLIIRNSKVDSYHRSAA
ncbi:beta-ketoacyl synthase N-terminal-like domain-containing protein [Stieleria marina]|uniref:3-oxoacyl-[acyl-carrier-protein] synthase 2 n=1 Tax=Stieleria marina TaxID=1930275 RepID=A0A517P382_9BACT|nr:3-oxoacyl-[acyl-carrier-protein] synthase 2 [Planctomycetes bacterium K23_9]